MKYYLEAFRKYATFTGRARRSEYWYFALFNILFAMAAAILDNIFGITMQNLGYGPIYCFYALVIIIPGLAVAVRRLHDVNKSGWFILIALIPLVGAVWLLVLFFSEGTTGENEYGENPKQSFELNS